MLILRMIEGSFSLDKVQILSYHVPGTVLRWLDTLGRVTATVYKALRKDAYSNILRILLAKMFLAKECAQYWLTA